NEDDQARSSGSIPSAPVALVRAIPDMADTVVCPPCRRQPGRLPAPATPKRRRISLAIEVWPGHLPGSRRGPLPPKGPRIGIAFSGGLDTRCAVAWMSRQGLDVFAYTADLAQPDETDVANIPPVATQHGAKDARLVDCRDALVREGMIAVQCGAF